MGSREEVARHDSRTQELAGALRSFGFEVALSDDIDVPPDPADFLFRPYPGGGIEQAYLHGPTDFVNAIRTRLGAQADFSRTVLFDAPRGQETVEIAARLQLAAALDRLDVWSAIHLEVAGRSRSYQLGFAGRVDVLRRHAWPHEDDMNGYARIIIERPESFGTILKEYLCDLQDG